MKSKLSATEGLPVLNQVVPVAALVAHPQNYKGHPASQVERLRLSLRKFGQVRSIVVQAQADGERYTIVAGHGVVQAAQAEDYETLRADVLPATWPPERVKAYLVADNELGLLAENDEAQLAALIAEAQAFDGELLGAMGYDEAEFQALLASVAGDAKATQDDPGAQIDKAEELQAKWNVQPGDLWQLGAHRLICGDCRQPETWARLLDGGKANGVFTSPPYAEQRKEQYGGTPASEYVAWWEEVQANVKANLAPDGSFFVNIKPHCEDGERVLYVFDLVLAMRRQWGWRYVDELCWTNRGFPGEPQDRFQNVFEPIYHFSDGKIKFRPKAVWHQSDSIPVHKAGQNFRQSNRGNGFESPETEKGMAYPRNVLDIPNGIGGDSRHAAAFPVALPDFFVRAYSDAGDVWADPFCGSGTTIVAAHNNKRRGMGIEMLQKYCAVILERVSGLGIEPVLVQDG